MFSFRVDGSDHSDPWILARHPSLENVIKKRLAAHAAAGKVTDRLSATAKQTITAPVMKAMYHDPISALAKSGTTRNKQQPSYHNRMMQRATTDNDHGGSGTIHQNINIF